MDQDDGRRQVLGLQMLNVLLIVSEINVDMSKWRSPKAFCFWLGLCPGNQMSGGKVLDSRIRQVVNRVADTLRLAAQSAGRTGTCLGIFYRQAHRGSAQGDHRHRAQTGLPHLPTA